ncbi:MAG TPA: GNAT family N-acyltransferase [Thermoanaerobaculaceae bacterium]|nr:GNAT family N-acyltransferase [Thermoanaerobaculaceae bacterium]
MGDALLADGKVFTVSRMATGGKPAGGLLSAALDAVSGLAALERRYGAIAGSPASEFLDRALERLGIRWEVADDDLERVPRTGPVVVVANHPFGGAEGLVLARVLTSLRSDVRVMGNWFLSLIPELRELFVPVDPFGGPGAAARSVRGLRDAIEFLSGGGLLAVFPAGEVASLDLRRGTVADPPWRSTAVRLARSTGASIVPVFFPGSNGPVFQLAGLLHPGLRTVLLPRQLLKRARKPLTLLIGKPLPPAATATADDRELTGAVRGRAALLAHRNSRTTTAAAARFRQPVAEPVPPDALRAEIDALPSAATLAASGPFRVALAHAQEIPQVLLEIGRAREVTFRTVGEGTGGARDLDRFDPSYLHLVLWDEDAGAVAGAYRLGPTDRFVRDGATAGLYTGTLFRFGPEGIARIHPAIEMGRSFIRPEYQRSHSALLLLWQGIGGFVVRNPHYRYLFGPVSISQEYGRVARELMVRYLGDALDGRDLLPAVRPRRPFPLRAPRGLDLDEVVRSLRSIDDLSAIVADLEGGRGIPVLVRQYLRLGGRVACFNVDRDFADVVDALVVVDLAATERKLLERYMGREGASSFLAYQAERSRGDAPRPADPRALPSESGVVQHPA